MSWDIDISQLSTDPVVPEEGQKYLFKLNKGAKYSKFKEGRIEGSATIQDGTYKGSLCYFSYPSANDFEWVSSVFARMIKALGVEPEAKEDPVVYLQRAAVEGGTFMAAVKHRSKEVDSIDTTVAEVNIMNVSKVKSVIG